MESETNRQAGNEGDFVCAPVLLIGFRRPDRIADRIRDLAKVRPAKVYVAIDGPRAGVDDDVVAVAQSRKQVELIDWPCDVHVRFLDENHSCRYAPPEAISWMLETESAGSIIEEDCAPTISFLRLASELLERYADDERIGIISGSNYFGFQSRKDESYHFSPRCDIWGWATWRRVWRHYDGTMRKYQSTVDELLDVSGKNRYQRFRAKYLRGVIAQPDTWDIQLSVMLTAKNYLCVHPMRNLVANVGLSGEGVHTNGFVYERPYYEHSEEIDFPLTHPKSVESDMKAYEMTELRLSSYLARALTVFGLKFGRFGFAETILRMAYWVERVAPWLFRI